MAKPAKIRFEKLEVFRSADSVTNVQQKLAKMSAFPVRFSFIPSFKLITRQVLSEPSGDFEHLEMSQIYETVKLIFDLSVPFHSK